jgi:ATP-binding cassette, subfamily B (MDR/TAP), member 1
VCVDKLLYSCAAVSFLNHTHMLHFHSQNSSWRVALVTLTFVPLFALTARFMMLLNESRGSVTVGSYQRAGSLAYSAVSAIRTVLSSNGVRPMVSAYADATQEAFRESVKFTLKLGFATGTIFNVPPSRTAGLERTTDAQGLSHTESRYLGFYLYAISGSMLGSFLLLYCVLTLYGTSLLYRDVRETGCDPSAGVPGAQDCPNTGTAVFGSMLGVAFAARGMSVFGNVVEVFSQARVATQDALLAMRRVPGSPRKVMYKDEIDESEQDNAEGVSSLMRPKDIETGEHRLIKAILPTFCIDSATRDGLKSNIRGQIRFEHVGFHYPTRPSETALEGLSFDVAAGETVALVGTCFCLCFDSLGFPATKSISTSFDLGPSGCGKSTVVLLLERFYDPTAGRILIDGVDLKQYNVHHLRSSIGYVGQVNHS